jgi:hypothetical protein
MSLQSAPLDDLDWRMLAEAIRGRIAAASAGQWTLHAPVDPGITLLELFAHLLDQRVYWLDQVPDSLLHALLALLGEQPQPARAAATVLVFRNLRSDVTELAAGLGMKRSGHFPAISFTTTTGLTLLPVRKVELHTADGERSGDLARGWRVRLLPADGGAAELQLVLWLDQPLPNPPPKEPLALLLDLDTPEGPPPQWSTEAVAEVPPPAELHWYYSGPAGTRQRLKAEYLDDGTGGLRRSGLLRIAIPDDWVPLGSTGNGPWRYALWATVERADFTAPPRLRQLRANAAIARHEKTVEIPWARLDEQLRDWLPPPAR